MPTPPTDSTPISLMTDGAAAQLTDAVPAQRGAGNVWLSIAYIKNLVLSGLTLAWGSITGTPTTLAGYGITDAAPNNATYLTQTANGSLSAEQALGALATGILKNTTTTGVLSIATVSDVPGVAVGRAAVGGTTEYAIPGVPCISSVGTKTLTANRIYYCPILVTTTITLDQLAVGITTAAAAGKLIRLAIYNADTSWQPTSRVVDAGTIAADPGAVPTVTAATINQQLTPGRYLLALISDGTPTLRTYKGGSGYLGIVDATASGIIFQLFVAGSGTTLPDPGTAWATASGGGGDFDSVILCRVSVP